MSPLLLSRFGWRGIFYIFGILGAPLLAAWWGLVPPDTPCTTTSTASSSGQPDSHPPREVLCCTVYHRRVMHVDAFTWLPVHGIAAFAKPIHQGGFHTSGSLVAHSFSGQAASACWREFMLLNSDARCSAQSGNVIGTGHVMSKQCLSSPCKVKLW